MESRQIIAPSILAADMAILGKEIKDVESAGASWIHVDVMDGQFVPNLSMGPIIVEACRRSTELPLDVHLMIETPEQLLQAFADAGADRLTVHIETCPHIDQTLRTIRSLGMLPGVAINPGTPVSAIEEVIGLVDLVLIMTVNPGYGGQKLIPSTLEKIRQVKNIRSSLTNAEIVIEVDGGINHGTAGSVVEAGADALVAGTAIFRHPAGIPAAINEFRMLMSPEKQLKR
jgi:ribulose-phosphate 3-epimerase